ncbi:MAG: 4Fe-4S binding protein [Calditrichia bacterium]
MDRINQLLRPGSLPLYLRVFMLACFIALVVVGFSAYSSNDNFLLQLRNFNLGNLIVWSYWWPLIVIGAVFLGRIWCFACPVELITSFFAKVGLKKKRPRFFLSGWGITLFYILILFGGIQCLKIHRNPAYMSLYLLTIVAASIGVGFLYEKNTFCRYLCPVGYLLGLYSRLSFLGWRVANQDICRSCKDKSCVRVQYRYNLITKSCGVDLYPPDITGNDTCILCTGCLKTCDRYKPGTGSGRPNPGFRLIGFARDLLNIRPLKNAEILFVFVVSGFVISEILSEWNVSRQWLNFIPEMILSLFPRSSPPLNGLIYGFFNFLLIPAILWATPFILSLMLGLRISFSRFTSYFGLAFLPIMAAAHVSKGVLKITSRLPYFQHIFSDISGMNTTRQFLNHSLILHPNPLWMSTLVSFFVSMFLITGIVLSFRVTCRVGSTLFPAEPRAVVNYFIPIVYGALLFIPVLLWRWFL